MRFGCHLLLTHPIPLLLAVAVIMVANTKSMPLTSPPILQSQQMWKGQPGISEPSPDEELPCVSWSKCYPK